MNTSLIPASNLVILQGDRVVTTSLRVAEVFGKLHKNVIRDIRNLGCSEKFTKLNFELCFENNELQNGKPLPFYEMTRDGFAILAMGFTGKVAMAWKESYIAAFNAMESSLQPSSDNLNALIDARIQLALGVSAPLSKPKKPQPKPLSALPRPDAHQRVLDYIRPLTEVVVADVQQDAAPDLSRVAIGKVIHRAGWTGKTCWRGTGAMRVWFAPMALH